MQPIKYIITTVQQYNTEVKLASDILTGRQFRRLRRAGKLNLVRNA